MQFNSKKKSMTNIPSPKIIADAKNYFFHHIMFLIRGENKEHVSFQTCDSKKAVNNNRQRPKLD